MSTTVFPDLYTKGSKVWVQDKETVWRYAIVKNNYKVEDKNLVTEDAEDGHEIVLTIDSPGSLPPLRNPDILIGANDLTSLSYLHEPAVLYNLRVRFLDQSAIYTWCGIVLVAVNPFSELEIYGDETIQTYHKSMGTAQLDPHIYAVAEDAFSKLERESRNQSIIVSGESGAGKTVSAKYAMRYFASIAGSQSTNIENRVLASNPIMEAIGNAKTTRNDNSSRFGKYIQIMFDQYTRSIVGGNMRTYLLEKSRVSRQGEGERNFHIFYQTCLHARSNGLKELGLDGFDFAYLGNQKPTKADDISKFTEAMQTLGFSEKQQRVILRVVAAILHAGNIQFRQVDEEQCAISGNDLHLQYFCVLLGLDVNATNKWLTHRVLRTGMKEVIVTPVAQGAAEQGRDALAKFIYEKMFSWVVSLINKALGYTKGETDTTQPMTFIGVLDIYGFEHFEINSFEQFCINYANEVLQQQFNQHVFKLEQEEYVREGIDWQFIKFTDNQPVIDLIEAKPMGVLSLLDEECKMPKGSDETWCAKLYAQLKLGEVFQKPKIGSRTSFIVQHFADKVIYTVDGFLEKNRDTVWEEQLDLLQRSPELDSIFADSDAPQAKAGVKMKITPQQQTRQSKQAKATVGSQFRDSLGALMQILNATTPHYVRCIKSNDNKAAFDFDNIRAVQQLRACGVLETIRISSNGFPSRWTYQDFANRYRVLLVGISKFMKKQQSGAGEPPVPLPRKLVRAGSSNASEVRNVCEQVVKMVYELQVYSQFKLPFEQNQQRDDIYQFGKTKIFFRAGQVALLERIRTQRLRECAILLQRMIKGWLCRNRYMKIQKSVRALQTYARGYLARKKLWHLKCTKAATIIQTAWRTYTARSKYLKLREATIGIQKYSRGMLARIRFQNIRQYNAATTIQRYWRGYAARQQYQKTMRRIVVCQAAVRRLFAKRILKQLKIEAKSVKHVTQLNKGLEIKIIELQTKIEKLNAELAKSKTSAAHLNKEKNDSHKLDVELKQLKNIISDKDKEIEKILSDLESKDKSYAGLEKKLSENQKVLEKLKEMNRDLESRFDAKAVEAAVADKEKNLLATFEREKKIMLEERESEKYSHQQLLRKYAALEDRVQGEENGYGGDDRSPDVSTVSMMMRCSELEQECAKVKHENQQMREIMAGMASNNTSDTAASTLAQQCATMQLELDRTREEKSNLKTIVLSQESSYGSREPSGDSEVISAFKAIVKQLERELEAEKERGEQLRTEINALRRDNERQQHLIGSNNSAVLQSVNEDFVTRINQENMLLREKNDKLVLENKKLRLDAMRNKILEDDVDDYGVNGVDEKGFNYLGMFKYNPQKEQLMLNILISELNPKDALKFPPHFPAYIIFMCIRYTDEVNDDNQVRSLLNNTIMTMKRTVKRAVNQQKVDVLVLWLANSCKMITCLKQYSGDEVFGVLEESLKNFDLSEYRQMFSDIAVWIYQGIIKQSEERLQPLIVPAVLEFEGLASSGIYSRPAQRTGSVSDDSPPASPTEKPVDALIKELNNLHKTLLLHVVDSELISQIFKQLFYFICAGALNNLLLRKDLCHWNKAMQIRFNLSALEQWCREQQIPKCNEIVEKLDPIIQATKLLQTKKTEEHITTIVEMCNKLSSSQVMKILNLYTAGDEESILSAFIKGVQQYLGEHRKDEVNLTLLMDTKYAFAMTIPYNPSDVELKKVTLPPLLLKKGLGTVLTKI